MVVMVVQHRHPIRRVSRSMPCPICGHAGWCGIRADGRLAICMRVSDGAVHKTRNGGWLHVLDGNNAVCLPRTVTTPTTGPTLVGELLKRSGFSATSWADRITLATRLGLAPQPGARALLQLGAWRWRKGRAWCFPMRDAAGRESGVRTRGDDGSKRSGRGSKEGLFRTKHHPRGERLFLVEGATDTVAALSVGLTAAGRPSCTGGVELCVALVRDLRPRQVVVVADGDAPGLDGARRLAMRLAPYVPDVRLLVPPAGTKDLRAWIAGGATGRDVLDALDRAPQVEVRVRRSS